MKMPSQIKLLLELHELETNRNGFEKTAAFQELEKKLDPSLFRLYQKLKERRGTGTAILRDGMCSGCMLMYPESHEMLRYKNTVHFCEYCGRLLVVTEQAA
jgi:predicted  nucleic acid-binding Zn-ribbon protein